MSPARPRRTHHDHLRHQIRYDKLLIALREGGTTKTKGKSQRACSARSLNKAVDAWRMMLAYGVERRELSHNVAASRKKSMKKVPRVRREMATYTPDEIRRVLRAADKDRSGHLWYLALSGLRLGEIAGLRWSDIDFGAGAWHWATATAPIWPTACSSPCARWPTSSTACVRPARAPTPCWRTSWPGRRAASTPSWLAGNPTKPWSSSAAPPTTR